MTGQTIFLALWVIVTVYVLWGLYMRGKRALSIFPDISTVKVHYRDKKASGHSTKNWKTKVGGARNSMDIVVTDKELWIKSMLLFAGILQQHDLLHRVPLDRITGTQENGKEIVLDFVNEKGEAKQIVVITRDKL